MIDVKQSGVGMAALGTSVAAAALLAGLLTWTWFEVRAFPPPHALPVRNLIIGVTFSVVMILDFFALGLSVGGLFYPDRRRSFAVAGLGLSGALALLSVCALVGATIIGLR